MAKPLFFTAVAALALLAAGPAAAEDWRLLMRTDVYAAAVDADSIRTGGTIASARLLTAPVGGPGEPGEVRAMAVMEMEIDCATRKKRQVGLEVIDPDGTRVHRVGTPDAAWDAVRPGSPTDALSAVLCKAEEMDPRSSADVVAFARFAVELPDAQ